MASDSAKVKPVDGGKSTKTASAATPSAAKPTGVTKSTCKAPKSIRKPKAAGNDYDAARPLSYTPIHISEAELSSGQTLPDTIQAGVAEFHRNGMLILENAIPTEIIDKLDRKMHADALVTLAWPGLVYNQGMGKTNFSQTPPPEAEFMLEEIFANRHAVAIMETIIGPRPQLCFASSNISLGNATVRQAVHSDAYADILPFTTAIEVFIYTEAVTPQNGSTELWPGTHVFTERDHVPHGRGWIKKSAMNRRARTSSPLQPSIPKGALCMRDLRLWHSGMPNRDPRTRIMVALIYFPQWFRCSMRLTLPESLRATVRSWPGVDIEGVTVFKPGPVQYLCTAGKMNSAAVMNFTQDPDKALLKYRSVVDVRQGRKPNADIAVTDANHWTPLAQRVTRTLTRGRD